MELANYNSENICRALGLEGFANDLHLAQAEQSIRLLLMPSFYPEICISFTRTKGATEVRVDAAREQIWLQHWPAPHKAQTDVATGTANPDDYDAMLELLERSATATRQSVVICDGMPTHCIHRKAGERVFDIKRNVSEEEFFTALIDKAVTTAWTAIDNPVVRNALRHANGNLPEQPVPPEKPVVRTVVLGSDPEAAGILNALEKLHAQKADEA